MNLNNSPVTPAIGNSLIDWIRILRSVPAKSISLKFLNRILTVGTISLVSTPFQVYEHFRLRKKIANAALDESPVFIIGHWRSGTTFLHNALCQDDQFGYITTLQSLFPHSYLTNPFFSSLAKIAMPPTRPMDDMKIYLGSPQEEEMAMVNLGPNSLYHIWHFPDQTKAFYKQIAKFEAPDQKQKKQWIKNYLFLLKNAAYRSSKPRLALKNPTNTSRIPTLLELFPNAKFIFIYRHPTEVYASTKKLYRKIVPIFQLQNFDFEMIRKNIIWIYKDLMTSYLNDRHLIPEKNLIEVKYEDFTKEPLQHLAQIYTQLDIPHFEANQATFEAYFNSHKKGKKGKYKLTEEELKEIHNEWAFAYKHFGYC